MLIYILFIVFAILIFIICSSLKKNFIKKMSTILYRDNNPELYLKKLDGVLGKIFLNKKTRLFRKIDAYAMKDDSVSVIDTFKELESKKLSKNLYLKVFLNFF